MPEFRILTANIGLGIPGANSLLVSFRSVFAFYGWRIIPFLLLRGQSLGVFNYTPFERKKREEFFAARSSLDSILMVIRVERPTILILNELIQSIHGEKILQELKKEGFVSFSWGLMPLPLDARVGTLVASKYPADSFTPHIRYLPLISGGGRGAGLRLRDYPITIMGCHLTVGKRTLSEGQIDDLALAAETERAQGREVILAGDFNETAIQISHIPRFRNLNLATITNQPTCPLGLPSVFRKDLDHVFIPRSWQISERRYLAFGSDHLAVVATVSNM